MNNLSFDELDIILEQKNGKIIHQIWFGTIPNKISSMYKFHTLQTFRESWAEQNPNFYYTLWDKNMCRLFLKKYYNEYLDTFNNYEYEIQRCDFIRYFILILCDNEKNVFDKRNSSLIILTFHSIFYINFMR